MNSLFAKILLWFWCTVAVYVVGSAFISALNVNRNASTGEAPVAGLGTFELGGGRGARLRVMRRGALRSVVQKTGRRGGVPAPPPPPPCRPFRWMPTRLHAW